MMNNPPHLPETLIIAILARVPCKSMMRFRCVCKAWNSYVHEPYFLQLRQSTNPNKDHFFFVCPNPSNWGDELSRPHVCLGQLPIHEDQAHLELNNSTHIISTMPPNILCSEIDVQFVNGLLCFHPKLYIPFCSFALAPFKTYICNPTTKQIVAIPEDSTIDFDSCDNEISMIMTHFGYDPIQDEFKVLRIIIINEYYFELKILTVGDYAWRDITHEVPYSILSNIGPLIEINGTCISGAIHWVDCDNKVIRAFDVGIEQFREIPVPDRLEIEKFGGMHDGVDRENGLKLMELGGNLGLVTYKNISHMELSTLKDYQNQVWIHQKIMLPEIPENIRYLDYFKMRYIPVCRIYTEEILLLPVYVRGSPIRVQYYDEKKTRCRGGLIMGFPAIFFSKLNKWGMRLFAYQENFKIL